VKQMSGDDSFIHIGDGLFKCKGCGEEVPSGIFNLSGHWAKCTGKEFTQTLLSGYSEKCSCNVAITNVFLFGLCFKCGKRVNK
jgi:hypothetical protein